VTAPDWYRSFFTELPNEFWRGAVPAEATDAEVRFVEECLGLAPGSRVLDVPCGSGRHAVALAVRGHRVVGRDISVEAVDHARAAARAAGVELDVAVGEMRELPREARFDAALCLGNSLGYLDVDGLGEFLGGLAAALRPGGGLVVDYAGAAESLLPGFDLAAPARRMAAGGVEVEASTDYDVVRGAQLSTYTFTRGAERTTGTAVHHVYTVAHLVRLLHDAGFSEVCPYAGPDAAPYVVGSPRLLLTARR